MIGLVRGLARLLLACLAVVAAVLLGFALVAVAVAVLVWAGVP